MEASKYEPKTGQMPRVFLASRMARELDELLTLRQNLFKRNSGALWVAEHSAPNLKTMALQDIRLACLERVRDCQALICIVDGTYGAWDVTDVSILELELFMAAASSVPLYVLRLGPFDSVDARLDGLLRLIQRVAPQNMDTKVHDRRQLEDEVQRIVDRQLSPKSTILGIRLVYEYLVQFCARIRGGVGTEDYQSDVQFLDGAFEPLAPVAPDRDLVEAHLSRAAVEKHQPSKLAYSWQALRLLSAVPYTNPSFAEWLPLWSRLLRLWSQAAAWYGLHGHHFLGRLAAINSSLIINRQMGVDGAREVSIHGNLGARASEYYSIAKIVPSYWDRRRWLRRALANVNEALEVERDEPSGLLAIRGNIRLAQRHVLAAIKDFNQVVQLRASAHPARLGEAEADLGLAYMYVGNFRKAQLLLESGVDRLRSSDNVEFTVRGMKKLGMFYALTLRRPQALRTLRHAYQLALQHGLEGQRKQISLFCERTLGTNL